MTDSSDKVEDGAELHALWPLVGEQITEGDLLGALVVFHSSIRPACARRVEATPHLRRLMPDILGDVEVRLLVRLTAELESRAQREFFGDDIPSFWQVVCLAASLAQRPSINRAEDLHAWLRSPEITQMAAQAPYKDAVSAILQSAEAHVVSRRTRDIMRASREQIVELLARRGWASAEHVRRGLIEECRRARRGPRSAPMQFDSEEAWRAYCIRVTESVLADYARRLAREQQLFEEHGDIEQ